MEKIDEVDVYIGICKIICIILNLDWEVECIMVEIYLYIWGFKKE